jgi:hypothetical protein
VSPLWSEYMLWLDAQRLCIVARGFPAGKRDTEAAPPVWHAFDGSLEQAIHVIGERLGTLKTSPLWLDSLHVVLGAPWVHGVSLPWQEGLDGPEQWAVYARTLVSRQVNDAVVASWDIRVDDAGYGAPRLAMGANAALLKALRNLARGHRLRLARIEASFVNAAHRLRHRLTGNVFGVAMLEPPYLTAAFYREGAWHGYMTLPWSADRPLRLAMREAAALLDEDLPERLYAIADDDDLHPPAHIAVGEVAR